jgi:hypothetical protein
MNLLTCVRCWRGAFDKARRVVSKESLMLTASGSEEDRFRFFDALARVCVEPFILGGLCGSGTSRGSTPHHSACEGRFGFSSDRALLFPWPKKMRTLQPSSNLPTLPPLLSLPYSINACFPPFPFFKRVGLCIVILKAIVAHPESEESI